MHYENKAKTCLPAETGWLAPSNNRSSRSLDDLLPEGTEAWRRNNTDLISWCHHSSYMVLRSFLWLWGCLLFSGEMADLSLKAAITETWLSLKSNTDKPVTQVSFIITIKNLLSVKVQIILHISGQDFLFALLERVHHGND